MHYYKRNLGDYAKKAGRLSMLQHGSYTLLIDACYDREQFPTMEEAIEWTWASTEQEEEAVRFVLRKFFILESDVYVQKRIQEELAEYHSKAKKNQVIAQEREANRKAKNTNREEKSTNREEIDANRGATVNEAPPNHKPLTTNQEPTTTTEPSSPVGSNEPMQCPVQKIVDAYHDMLPENPQIKVLSEARRRSIKSRWNEAAKLNCKPFGYKTVAEGLEAWDTFFGVCAESKFLTGRSAGQQGKPAFIADIDFIMSPQGFAKILENKYHRDAE